MDPIGQFEAEKKSNIERMAADAALARTSTGWINDTSRYKYTYNFTWLGRPIIQFPQDIIAMQELVWRLKPDLIIETGIAHGGSILFYASILELIGGNGKVLGIDVDIRKHNRDKIESHPMFKRVEMIEGSSIDSQIAERVCQRSKGLSSVLVVLDSNHTHAHVLQELNLYSPLVTKNSYIVVFDTVVEQMPKTAFPDRPWGPGDNPKTAVDQFLKANRHFEIDREIENKLLITVAPGGYLKRVG